MAKINREILEEVIRMEIQLNKVQKKNPADPAIAELKAQIDIKMATEDYKRALEAEEQRMGEELKKIFQA